MWMVTVPVILALGIASGWFSGSGNRDPWFATLNKPAWMPPTWAFPVAWTILYILMGVAVAQVLKTAPGPLRAAAITLFVVQLALNLAWSPVFFGAHRIAAGLGVIVALDAAVLATILLFARIATLPAVLLLPYAAWLAIATALNLAILRLNP